MRNPLRPFGHTVDGSEKTAHRDKDKHEEPHDEHGLLQRCRMIGYDQPEPRHHRQKHQSHAIDSEEMPPAECRKAAMPARNRW